MFRDLELQFNATIRRWNEPTDDLGGTVFEVVQNGRVILADSLALLIAELQVSQPRPLILLAA